MQKVTLGAKVDVSLSAKRTDIAKRMLDLLSEDLVKIIADNMKVDDISHYGIRTDVAASIRFTVEVGNE